MFSVVTYHALNAYTAVFLGALLLIIRQVRAPNMGRLVAIGLLGGAAALLRSEFVLFMGVLYIALWAITRRTKEFAILVVLSAAVVLPWTIRNYVVFDRIIPIASSVGYNLWKGHNPEATGSGDEIEKIGAAKRQLGDVLVQVPRDRNYEIGYDQVFRDAALAHIRAHPLETIVLGLKKNLLFWAWEARDPISWKPAYLVPHIVTSLLAVAGIVLIFRQGVSTAAIFIIAIAVMQSLINAAFSVHVRYRMTIEPILFIYAGVACVALLKAWWHRAVAPVPADILELRRPVVSCRLGRRRYGRTYRCRRPDPVVEPRRGDDGGDRQRPGATGRVGACLGGRPGQRTRQSAGNAGLCRRTTAHDPA